MEYFEGTPGPSRDEKQANTHAPSDLTGFRKCQRLEASVNMCWLLPPVHVMVLSVGCYPGFGASVECAIQCLSMVELGQVSRVAESSSCESSSCLVDGYLSADLLDYM